MTLAETVRQARPPTHERCDREQVQNIGHIQSHGLLCALSEPDLIVRRVSANTSLVLGLSPQALLGRSIERILGPEQFQEFSAMIRSGLPLTPAVVHPVSNPNLELHCLAHRETGTLIVEFEILAGARSLQPLNIDTHIRIPLSRLEAAADILELSRLAAAEVRELSRFDRVMVYRFDEEWNGEVVAEIKESFPVSYLGQRFPASDIPPQVRRLFLLNRLRAIADVDSAPVPVLPPEGEPLDLTDSVLRSAAPIHLEYLRNMNVKSSMTVSIVVDRRLWGMIACHDPAPHRVDHTTRAVCELIGQTLGSQIALRIDNAALQARLAARKVLERLAESPLNGADAELLEVFDADALIYCGNGVISSHAIPVNEESLARLVEKLRGQSRSGVAACNRLAEFAIGWAAGALYVGLSANPGDYMLFLRREMVETVVWAGNPHETVTADEHDALHPRASFGAWSETVRGRSRPWTEPQLESALFLRARLCSQARERVHR